MKKVLENIYKKINVKQWFKTFLSSYYYQFFDKLLEYHLKITEKSIKNHTKL